MRAPLEYLRRLARNPKKYTSREWLRVNLKPEMWRARMNATYGAHFVLKSVRARKIRKVAVFPSKMNLFQPAESYVAWKVFKACGLAVCGADDPNADLAIAWHPATQYEIDRDLLARHRARHPVINGECTDIRKSRVGQAFSEIFGYRLEIDPLEYQGVLVRKSERNGPHDAVLLQGPLDAVEPGYVYQRLVNNETSQGQTEWRVFIVGGEIISVYANHRPTQDRFRPIPSSSELCGIDDVFTEQEQRNIAAFCKRMALDFGVLDVLRDQNDGRMYICDCNNTPTGPAEILGVSRQLRVVHTLADAFERAFLSAAAR